MRTPPTDGCRFRHAFGRRVDRLDEFVRPGWRVLSRHHVPDSLFTDDQRGLLARLKVEFVHISRGAGAQYADIDGEYDLWFRRTGRKAFLVRPDHYVFGSVKTIQELPGLLDVLETVLTASGWLGGTQEKIGRDIALEAVQIS